jgi:ankyrin repeat protein
MAAAGTGQLQMIELLIAKGADMSAATPEGITALALAEAKERANVVEFLKARGAKLHGP